MIRGKENAPPSPCPPTHMGDGGEGGGGARKGGDGGLGIGMHTTRRPRHHRAPRRQQGQGLRPAHHAVAPALKNITITYDYVSHAAVNLPLTTQR